MSIRWLTPAASFAIKHRKDFAEVVASVWARIFGKQRRLAITGMQGVGKTVLLDALTGKAFQQGYTVPTRSQAKESGVVPGAASRILLTTVPRPAPSSRTSGSTPYSNFAPTRSTGNWRISGRRAG